MPRLRIFDTAIDGYGDAVRASGGASAGLYVEPRRLRRQHSYNRCVGSVDARWPGEIRAGVLMHSHGVGFNEPPIAAIEWEDSSGVPLILVVGDAKAYKFQPSPVADVTLTGTATGVALHDDGSGVPYVYFGEGGTSTYKVQRRDRAGTLTTFTNLYANKLLSIGNDLYITGQFAGGFASCGVGKIDAGTSIVLGLAQPGLTVVGRAQTPINNLVEYGRMPVALKPEGIFVYDRATTKWFNVAKGQEWLAHEDNGKVFWPEDGNLIVAMGQGGAVRFDGSTIEPYDLLSRGLAAPNADTTTQVIACAAAARHYGMVATKIGAKRTRGFGGGAGGYTHFAKSTDSGATWATDYTSQIFDSLTSTTAVLDALATATGYMLLIHPEPFAGFQLSIGTPNTNEASLSIEYWNGSAFTAVGSIIDHTETTPAAVDVALSRTGWIFPRGPSDLIAAGWTSGTFTIAGSSVTGFALRLKWSANLSATVRVHTVDLAPYRPSIDPSVAISKDSLDRSGGLSHILFSYTDDQGRHITHDMGTPGISEEYGCAVYGRIGFDGGGIYLSETRMPAFFGRKKYTVMAAASDDRPAVTDWPRLHTWLTYSNGGLIEFPMLDLSQMFPSPASGTPPPAYKLTRIAADGEDWHATGYIWMRFDDGRPWQRLGSFDKFPFVLPVSDGRAGAMVQFAAGWEFAGSQSLAPGHPRITSIDADFEPVATVPQRLPRQSPPIV